MPEFQTKAFDELTTRELHNIYLTRELVFTVGQKITEQEIDDVDTTCFHLFAQAETGEVLACARMFDLNGEVLDSSHTRTPHAWTIGRVAVLDKARGQGLGQQLMQTAIAWISANTNARAIHLTAQSYLKDTLYKNFTAHGEEFLEAGIPHYHMVLELDNAAGATHN